MRFAWHLLASCLFFLSYFSRYRLRRRTQKRTGLRAFPGMSCRVGAPGPGPARCIFLNIFHDFRVFRRKLAARGLQMEGRPEVHTKSRTLALLTFDVDHKIMFVGNSFDDGEAHARPVRPRGEERVE